MHTDHQRFPVVTWTLYGVWAILVVTGHEPFQWSNVWHLLAITGVLLILDATR